MSVLARRIAPRKNQPMKPMKKAPDDAGALQMYAISVSQKREHSSRMRGLPSTL